MDIEPRLTPSQEYAIKRISEIVKNNPSPKRHDKIKCCYKMIISAGAMLATITILPTEIQEKLQFIHLKAHHTQYTSPIEIEENSSRDELKKAATHYPFPI